MGPWCVDAWMRPVWSATCRFMSDAKPVDRRSLDHVMLNIPKCLVQLLPRRVYAVWLSACLRVHVAASQSTTSTLQVSSPFLCIDAPALGKSACAFDKLSKRAVCSLHD